MQYVFISHFVTWVLKGKHKSVQTIVALLLFFIPITNLKSLVGLLVGKPIDLIGITNAFLFIYFSLNLTYVLYNKDGFDNKQKPTGLDNNIKSTSNTYPESDARGIVLEQKNYSKTQTIKRSPHKPISQITAEKHQEEILPEAPPLEINYDSAEDLIEDDNFPEKEYDGVINQSPESSSELSANEKKIAQENTSTTDDAAFSYDQQNKTKLFSR